MQTCTIQDQYDIFMWIAIQLHPGMSSPFPYSCASRSSNPKIHPLGKQLHHHRRIPCLQSPRSVLRTLRPSDSSQPTASIKLTKSVVLLPASFYRIKRSADATICREPRALDQLPRHHYTSVNHFAG